MDETMLSRRDARWMSLIGLCPALLVCETLTEGIVLSVTVLLALVSTDAVVTALSRRISVKYRTPASLVPAVLILGILKLVWMLIPQTVIRDPGFFAPLLTIYCILLGRTHKTRLQMAESLRDALKTGILFTLVLALTTGLRELLGAGTLLGIRVLGEGYSGAAILTELPGGMLVLGFVMAAYSVAESVSDGRSRRRARRAAVPAQGQEEENS